MVAPLHISPQVVNRVASSLNRDKGEIQMSFNNTPVYTVINQVWSAWYWVYFIWEGMNWSLCFLMRKFDAISLACEMVALLKTCPHTGKEKEIAGFREALGAGQTHHCEWKQALAVTLCSSLVGSCSGASPHSSFSFMWKWLVYIEQWLSWSFLNPWWWSYTSLSNWGRLPLAVFPVAPRPFHLV